MRGLQPLPCVCMCVTGVRGEGGASDKEKDGCCSKMPRGRFGTCIVSFGITCFLGV